MHPSLRHAMWLSVAVLLTSAAAAQSSRLTGTVTDAAAGVPLANVTVSVLDTPSATTTEADGQFSLPGLSTGPVTVEARSVGFETVRQRIVLASGIVRLDFTLSPINRDLDEVVVEGRATNLVGVANAASQGVVGQEQLALRPLLRVGEVLETIPGTIVTQHSGSGKANQFFLRGFNLDHGTDFSASIEGVPMNLPTHAHGQGYLDLNGLIPELVERVAFEKGPLNASVGDFSTAGHAEIGLVRRLDRSLIKAELGPDGEAGLLAAGSAGLAGGDLLFGVRARAYDGPWVQPENSTLLSGVAKLSGGTEVRGWSVTALGYASGWDATDQVALRAVEQGRISRLGALDSTNGGRTARYTLAGDWRTTSAAAAQTEVRAYAAYYDLDLFSNFTYFLDDPVRGDQFEQVERRIYGGGGVSHRWLSGLGPGAITTLGADLRHDQIFDVGLHRTQDRQRIGTVRQDQVAQTAGGAYARTEAQWTDWFRTTAGLRGDVYRFEVDSGIAANSGTRVAGLISPKAGLALRPWRHTEVTVSGGLGFHSNDARGTTITLDPASGEAAERVDPLVRTRGGEFGVRTAVVPGLQSAVALWAIGLDSELLFVGDAGGTEASGASRHIGVEWTNHVEATDWLSATVDVALTRSRFTEEPQERIENSVGRVVTGGVYAGHETGPLAALQLRYLGPRPLTGDGLRQSDATTLLNAKIGYRTGRLAASLDVLNMLDSKRADVSYFYASRLRDEPAAGVEDTHVHPIIPRTVRLTLQGRF